MRTGSFRGCFGILRRYGLYAIVYGRRLIEPVILRLITTRKGARDEVSVSPLLESGAASPKPFRSQFLSALLQVVPAASAGKDPALDTGGGGRTGGELATNDLMSAEAEGMSSA